MPPTNEYPVLPAGISQAVFARALDEFRKVVGEEFVIADAARMVPYRKIMLPVDEAAHTPGGVVMPNSVEQVQGILSICNKYKVPVWPISTGRNFGYGSASVATRGQVLLDLRRMNRILEVDPVLCTALVEPGVTYKQLQDYLAEKNIPLWLDFPAPGPLVGPTGNTLERGGGQTPYGDHFANSCGMEVVLADGTVLRTGLGGVTNSNSWQSFKYGYGPYLDGIFTQSNFGVVTKLGMWLMPKPAGHRTLLAMWWDDNAVTNIIDTLRPLRYEGLISNFGVLVNDTLALTSFTTRAEVYPAGGVVPDAVVHATAKAKGIAPWLYSFSVYGRPEQIALNVEIITQALQRSGATVIADVHDPMQVNELSLETFKLFNWVGGGGLAWFSPVAPTIGSHMARQCQLAKAIMTDHGFDFMTGATLNGRDTLNVMPLVFNRNDEEQTRRADRCFKKLLQAFAAEGYGFYRTGIGYMDEVAHLSGATNLAVNRRLKRALDPNGIMAPGKSGIYV